MSGRIADIAVHPARKSTWYVAAGSGGVWKTTNAGTTWTPVFDDQPSYSIGEITLDPTNPDVVWVGTGENVSGRHVGWGDGVYRSRDAGRTWQRMGLPNSQHIGRILVDPRDGDVVLVAAEGPLWSPGGDRGVYRTTDGGATWSPVLQIDENTGVTDLEFDPSNPDVVYAAAYQRRRHVWGFLGGGPKSGLWKSTDNGKTWRQVTTGLPKGDMGKIGLAVTPADPSLVYATIEASAEERGFYRSRDRGESWEKRNSYISGGTGPHYYQELEASPTNPDLVYQMDVFLHVTRDGGKTIDFLETGYDKHSDNHALHIDPDDGAHLIVGTDAGVYESFDEGKTWRHFPNLPVSQFYKVALSNREPFYDILGGAQDLGTLHGPRSAGPRPDVPDVAGGDVLPEGPEERGGRQHPAPARARRRARALELGLTPADQPAQRRPGLLRLPAPLAERRPGQQLDRHQRRPDSGTESLRAAFLWQDLERGRAVRPRGDVQVRHHHLDLRVAGQGRGPGGRHRRRAGAGVVQRRPELDPRRGAPRARPAGLHQRRRVVTA